MKKFEAWPELMNAYFRRALPLPMRWGEHDCCMMAANCVLDMTGEDFAIDFRGKYDDGPSAYKALMDFGGGGILETMRILAKRHDWTELDNVLKTQRGDIVMIPPVLCGGDERYGGALGMCVGTLSGFVSAEGMRSMSTVPLPGQPGIIHSWRIPHGRD